MKAQKTARWERPITVRITENPALVGLVLRERGELVEYVSYTQAATRQSRADKQPVRLEGHSSAAAF